MAGDSPQYHCGCLDCPTLPTAMGLTLERTTHKALADGIRAHGAKDYRPPSIVATSQPTRLHLCVMVACSEVGPSSQAILLHAPDDTYPACFPVCVKIQMTEAQSEAPGGGGSDWNEIDPDCSRAHGCDR